MNDHLYQKIELKTELENLQEKRINLINYPTAHSQEEIRDLEEKIRDIKDQLK